MIACTGDTGKALMTDNSLRDLPALDARFLVPEYVLMRRVGEEEVLLNLDDEQYYGLNPVGARLIEFAAGGATLRQIVDALLGEFEVEREALELDLRQIAAELLAAGLIVERGAC